MVWQKKFICHRIVVYNGSRTDWKWHPFHCMPPQYSSFLQVHLYHRRCNVFWTSGPTQITMMAVSIAYRHHGDLHSAVLRLFSSIQTISDTTRPHQGKTQAARVWYFLGGISTSMYQKNWYRKKKVSDYIKLAK